MRMQRLDLSLNHLAGDVARRLCLAFGVNQGLTHLLLDDNHFGSLWKLLLSAITTSSIESLSVLENGFPPEAVTAFCNALESEWRLRVLAVDNDRVGSRFGRHRRRRERSTRPLL
eukprot:m.123624 g.123624  ORF g.123624 m.123624 type:complete len:115 (+) comp9653_c0_seq3:1031-1375(+)